MAKRMGISEFLGHRTGADYGTLLDNWKDRKPVPPSKNATINTVMHRTAGIYCLYIHKVPRIVVKDDKSVNVWTGNYVCWEDEQTLRRQYQRHEDDTRKYPPKKCGLCKMNEWFYQAILDEKFEWTDEVFRFEGDEREHTRVIHAGGMCNLFNRRDLSDEEKKDLKEHGIFQKDAWKESLMAKANYLFTIVDYDDPKSGVQQAIQPALIGDKVQEVMADQIADHGEENGDPFVTPYVIQWEHDDSPKIEFNKKYKARALRNLKITNDIIELINEDPPDSTIHTRPFNIAQVRKSIEEAATMKNLPFDEWFGAEEGGESEGENEAASAKRVRSRSFSGGGGSTRSSKSEPADEPEEKEEAEEKSSRRSTPPPKSAKGNDSVQNSDGTITINGITYTDDDPACDNPDCDKPVKDSDKKCPHCGFNFSGEPEPEPPPQRRRRGATLAEVQAKGSEPKDKATPAKGTTAPADKAPAAGRRAGKEVFPDDGKDVPF